MRSGSIGILQVQHRKAEGLRCIVYNLRHEIRHKMKLNLVAFFFVPRPYPFILNDTLFTEKNLLVYFIICALNIYIHTHTHLGNQSTDPNKSDIESKIKIVSPSLALT